MFSTMFSLFLLSAAAGVNAILGGEVRGVHISNKEYICAEDCVYRNVYFLQSGGFCPEKEIVAIQEKGPTLDKAVYLECNGTSLLTAPRTPYREVPRFTGPQLFECGVGQIKTPGELLCHSYRSLSGKEGKMVSWKEIEKELPSAKSEGEQGTPEKNKPAPQKPKQPLTPKEQECADKTVHKFNSCKDNTCRENIKQEFRECRNNKDKSAPEKNKPTPQKPKQPLTPKEQECANKTVPKFNGCKDNTCRENIKQEFRECMTR
ncbi:hypothetical protein E5D57_001514 [Metarhizium anisopliae]|nr:hypothetical protein E5D57_001514 [Metarhizium anisopliae]